MSRNKSVIKNTIWEMGYYIAVIALGFLAPRFIILYYSSEVNGLNSTVQQIINVILILQSGASTAAVYSLYKPIADNDYDSICENIVSAERLFKKISYIFGAVLLVAAAIAPFVIDTTLDRIVIFLALIIMGAKSFVDLYFTARFRIIFTAYQQKYFVSIATLIEQVVYYALVFASIFLRWHYIFLYLWLLLGCIVKIICLDRMLYKTHRDIYRIRDVKGQKSIAGKNYALANELSHTFMGSSVTIIMSVTHGLAATSVFSIYSMVNSALELVATSLYSSFAPSFGNLVAQEDKKRIEHVFSTFQYMFVMFGTFLMMCMLFLVVPFVKIYTQGVKDIDYINYTLATIMSIVGIFSFYRIPYNIAVSTNGFFKETWKQPVISVVVGIAVSIVAGTMNYTYILFGSLVFYIINFVYQHFTLKSLVPYMIHNNIFSLLAISGFGIGVTILLNRNIVFPEGIISWTVYACLYALGTFVYLAVVSFIFERKQFKDAIAQIKIIIDLGG